MMTSPPGGRSSDEDSPKPPVNRTQRKRQQPSTTSTKSALLNTSKRQRRPTTNICVPNFHIQPRLAQQEASKPSENNSSSPTSTTAQPAYVTTVSIPANHVHHPRPISASRATFLLPRPRPNQTSTLSRVIKKESRSPAPRRKSKAPQPASPLQSDANVDGYKILRSAVPPEHASSLGAVAVSELPCPGQVDSHLVFVPPVQAYVLRDDFMKVSPLVVAFVYNIRSEAMNSGLIPPTKVSLH